MATIDIPLLTVNPTQPHTHTVVFLHGRGDNAHQFAASLAASRDSRSRTLAEAFPSFRWVFPQAPSRELASAPGTVWPQWFDVWDVRDFASREALQAVGLREVLPALTRVLAGEAAALGGRWDRVVLAGISMGAATGVHLLFNLDVPGRLAAFVGFSCRCPFAGRDLAGMRAAVALVGGGAAGREERVIWDTPALLEHCADDPLVLVQDGRRLRDTLRGFGMRQVEWREYPSGGHWFNSPQGIDDAVEFLTKYVVGEGNVADGAGLTGFQGMDDAMRFE
ncbi:Alpha/Beta hydrolase protein [Lasiosphaeris hirsuta]|uniref:Alpha/Beta hydrolase protein n=1 Tax=Lasiosphaeris hirsuta TaxID=260670 RepID=A0AA40DKU6_9PEZI|nr:Alpha/Beta hydrolase protein [Lasiosphaeris hirsuta]